MATGGFKLSLAGAKGKHGLKAPLEKVAKRRRLALDDEEPEDATAKQEITGWDAAEGGAVDANAKKEEQKGPRVIPALPNRNRREEALKRHVEKPEPMDVEGEESNGDARTEEERLQQEAVDALVRGKSANDAVIPVVSEEETLRNDLRDAPDAPTLAAYEATPIEGFGAALLRGMGWKGDEAPGSEKKAPKEIKRRPALLGIGAKPEAAAGIELEEFGSGAKKWQKKTDIRYTPVALRNKHTGELITEEELKARLEKQKEADAKAARDSTVVGDEDEEDERRRQKRRERKERDRREDDYDSERRREKKYSSYEDSDRDRRRERKHRDEEYDERRRDRHREKSSRRRARSRSPYDDARREQRRERDRRDRSRSRDSDDRRRKRREHDHQDDSDGRRSKYKDDKYSRR
ncbi:hypothetical protein BU23DRAFT_553638 [Bimuria novae-zelandiae CBS 107.79]|uniref:Pre-mRNA-splicing factor n=1 Tax=Bimuria novae-zelandiae CBS 107.79 TaxID=1447943 RepID=A0A6A5VFY9_9PLEO|nr:hypothetical protein BU23DRAFT_553638 [Bimuria novae-zelandiae CBS 107.79]